MASQFDAKRAIAYDQKQGYSREQIQTIQRVTGSDPSGEWTEAAVKAVCDWQARVGLSADGMVGAGTWRAVQRVAAMQSKRGNRVLAPKLGVWVDDQPATVLADGWLSDLAELGFSTIAIMVQRSTSSRQEQPWTARWTTTQLAALRKLAQPLRLDIVLTTWPLPDKDQLAQLGVAMPPLLDAAGAVAFEVDTEGNWDTSRLAGFASMDEAAQALVATMRSAAASSKARLELTTYPYHSENDAKAMIAPHMDRLFPQAYSVAERRGSTVPWDDRLGPGRMQALSVHRAESIPGVAPTEVALGLGLAAYNQSFSERTVAEALAAALEAAQLQHIPEVRYWSSRWILGSSGNAEVAGFFAARSKGRVPKITAANTDHDEDLEAARAENPV